jgi:hypothetical protein
VKNSEKYKLQQRTNLERVEDTLHSKGVFYYPINEKENGRPER